MISKRTSRTIITLCAIGGLITSVIGIKCNETQKEVDVYIDLKGKVEIFRPEVIQSLDSVSAISKVTYNIYNTYVAKTKSIPDSSLYQDLKNAYDALYEIVKRFDSLLIKFNSNIDSLNNLSVSQTDIDIYSSNLSKEPNFFSKFIHIILKFFGILRSETARYINTNKDDQDDALKYAKFILNEIEPKLNESDKRALVNIEKDTLSGLTSTSERSDTTVFIGDPNGGNSQPIDSPKLPPVEEPKLSLVDSLKQELKYYLKNSEWSGLLYLPYLNKERVVYVQINNDCSEIFTNYFDKSNDTLTYSVLIDYDPIKLREYLEISTIDDENDNIFVAKIKIVKQPNNRAKFVLKKFYTRNFEFTNEKVFISRILE